jgi:hypothetical protein
MPIDIARPELPPDDLAVDLGAGQEGEHDGAETGEKVHPRHQLKADGVAGEGADDDLHQRHRHGDADRDDGGRGRSIASMRARRCPCARSPLGGFRPPAGSRQERERATKKPPCGGSETDSHRLSRGRSHQPLRAVSGNSIPISSRR